MNIHRIWGLFIKHQTKKFGACKKQQLILKKQQLIFMSSRYSLSRTTERMINFLEKHHQTKYNGSLEDFMPLIQTMQSIFPDWVIMSCPVHHKHIRFITANCMNVLGFSPEFFRQQYTPDALFSRLHEDDADDVRRCFLFADGFFKNRMSLEYPKLRCVFYYRYRNNDGSYSIMHDEKAVLFLKDNDLLYYSLVKDITGETIFSGACIEIYKHDANRQKIASFKPGMQKNPLSKRETELIHLIKKGLTTKEMAYHLNISQHTIRNIKQKMFTKYNVSNAIELLNKTVHHN